MALIAEEAGYLYGRGTGYATRALDGVSLVVEKGGLTLVLGATGSGKSTLLRLCAGLDTPTEGRVTVDSADTAAGAAAVTSGRVGLVFQRPEAQLFAETVLDDVAFGPRNLGRSAQAKADAVAALVAVGLDPSAFGERSPFTLSGGEARRVAIAGVLAMRPDYLLLDEPTAGLDADGRSAVIAAIRAARRHAGIVVVSHDPEEFLAEADDVLVLARGSSVFSGSVRALADDPGILDAAGLVVPPVLQLQRLGRSTGLDIATLELDPIEAACAIAQAMEDPR